MLEACPAARFLFVGRDDGIRGELEARARKLGCPHAIVFAGARRDIPDLLAAMDIYLCASHEEGFSNVLLEAMSAGLPAVCTDVGSIAEVVDDTNGRLIASGDVGALTQALGELLTEDALRARLSDGAFATWNAGFTSARMASRVAAVWAAAVEGRGDE